MAYIPKRESEKIDLNFFIRTLKVVDNAHEYHQLQVVIKDANGQEINHEQVLPEELTVHSILKNIEKFYNVMYTQNKKLAEGAREEILKKVALLLWMVGE